MKKIDTLYISCMLAMLVTITHFSLLAGACYAAILVILNLIEVKEKNR